MGGAAAADLIERVLGALSGGEMVGPDAVTLLVREYSNGAGDDVGESIGLAVAWALAEAGRERAWSPVPTEGRSDGPSERAAWLMVFADVAEMSDDERLHPAINTLCEEIAASWPARDPLGTALRSVAACLRGAVVAQPSLVAGAVDELERLVGATYQPGQGLTAPRTSEYRGTPGDHVQMAAALLTAHAVTSRLPYAMLADDLMQFASRSWWLDVLPAGATLEAVAERCEACRVLTHLAAIHADPEYTRAAVSAPGYDHVAYADRLLEATSAAAARIGIHACIHALARGELTNLKVSD